MNTYNYKLKSKVEKLRKLGKTYTEINQEIDLNIPKSTLSNWCRNVLLPQDYTHKIDQKNIQNLKKARKIALKVNKTKRKRYLKNITDNNIPIAKFIDDESTSLIALSMLCLGEASKSKTKHKSFTLGSSDPKIIIIFLVLLKRIVGFNKTKLRFTVQCRADQDIEKLEKYWRNIIKMPKKYFYSTRVDPRTINKPTKNKKYYGVLVIDYFDTKVQLILESLADLVYNRLESKWAHSVVG